MGKKKLSVVLAVFNEQENIVPCLQSIKGLADEIIVVDGSSDDKTPLLAKKLGARVFVVSNKAMFHKNKQLALERATADWILQLDADERVTSSLRDEIRSKTSKSKEKGINGYYLPRRNYFLGKFLTKGGQYPDYVIRLVKNGKAYFPCQSVHEQIRVRGPVDYLENPLIHLTAPSFSRYLQNANRYTSLTADKLKENKISLNLFNKLKYLFYLPLKTFIMIFFRHRGFQDGFPGFVFALFSGLHYSLAFIKYWEQGNK